MTGKRKILLTVLSLLLVCNLAFIWGNSLVSRSDSHDLSVGVLDFLPGFIRDLFPNQEQLAHCAEDGPLYRIRLPGRAVLRAAGHGTDREAAPLLLRVGGRLFCGCHR